MRRISSGAKRTTSRTSSGTRLKAKSFLVPEWKSGVVETMITPSRTSATRFSIVCETRVPSRTGKVSRIRPVRRARARARAGSPRRAGRVADISTPIIVAEVTSRRRIGRLGSAARAIQYQEAARKKSELAIRAQAISTQVRLERTMLSTTLSTPIFCAASRVRPTPRTPATARPSRRATARPRLPAWAGAGSSEGSRSAGRLRPAVGGAQPGPVGEPLAGADRPRRLDRPLVDRGHLVGDPRPGVALGAAAGGLAHLPQALGLVVDPLQLLGQALRIAGRNQQAVDAVADDVAVAGDGGGDHRRAGGEGLGQDHAEALARERGGAEHVGPVQLGPEALAGDAAADVDEAQQLGVGDVAEDVLALGADHGQPAGDVLDQGAEGGEQDRQPLALLGAADEEDPQLARRAASASLGAASTSTPLGMIVYSPPNQRRPVQAAASETAIRAESRLKTRRAPSALAM